MAQLNHEADSVGRDVDADQRESDLKSAMSDFRFQISDFRFQIWFPSSPKLHRHLKLPVAQRAGADDLAHVNRARATGTRAGDLQAATLADRQWKLELEGNPAERHVAREHVMH